MTTDVGKRHTSTREVTDKERHAILRVGGEQQKAIKTFNLKEALLIKLNFVAMFLAMSILALTGINL